MTRRSLTLLLLFFGALGGPGAAAARADDNVDSGYGGGRFYGRLKSELRWENTHVFAAPDAHDLAFYQGVTLGTEKLGLDNLDTRFVGRFARDLDDRFSPLSGRDLFLTPLDTIHSRRELYQVYTAYARLRDVGGAADVTVGRQSVQEIEWAHFDGVSVDAKKLGGAVSVGGFFGRRAVLWEDFSTKLIGGGHVTWHALDWLDFKVSDVMYKRNSLGLSARATAYEDGEQRLYLTEEMKFIGARAARNTVSADYSHDDLGIEAYFAYAREFSGANDFPFSYTIIDDRVRRLNLPTPAAYDDIELRLGKKIVRPFGVFAGVIRHHLDADQDGAFEASYWQPSAGADLSEWPVQGLYAEVKFTYAGYHRPGVDLVNRPLGPADPSGVVLDDALRGEGERNWFEVSFQVRQKIGKAALVGFEYVYREFDYHSKFQSLQGLSDESFRVFLKVDVGEIVHALHGLSVRVDYWNERDLPFVYEENLKRAEGVWGSVEYAW